MRLIGIIDHDHTVPCASCHTPWNVRYLLRDLGRPRLRAEGFAFILFDDDAISVNYCPDCQKPAQVRAPETLHAVSLRMAA
jgi:endogenous inhibitor of DNA gyrase (YacG/DUF329 family)